MWRNDCGRTWTRRQVFQSQCALSTVFAAYVCIRRICFNKVTTSSTRSSCLVLRLNLRSSTGPGCTSVVPFDERRANLKKRSWRVSFVAVHSKERVECRALFEIVLQWVTGSRCLDFSTPIGLTSKFFYYTFLLGCFLSDYKVWICWWRHRASATTILNHETWRKIHDRSEQLGMPQRANNWSKHRITVVVNVLGQG